MPQYRTKLAIVVEASDRSDYLDKLQAIAEAIESNGAEIEEDSPCEDNPE